MEPELLRFTTAGGVDDGKSTLIGRLLHDANAVYEDQLNSVRRASPGHLDFAFITDGLHAEREQGITIDVAYRYFSTPRRRFIVADTPGHEQYTRNMVTGASTADLAVILLDSSKGVLPQTRRHASIAWLLGIRRIVFAINKMDSVSYRYEVFEEICHQIGEFTPKLLECVFGFIPVSALRGDNVVKHSERMPWFKGRSLLEYLETVPLHEMLNRSGLRFPVQYVIRAKSNFRGYAGQIAGGRVQVGDRVKILPSGRSSTISSISIYNGNIESAEAPASVTLCLEDQVDVSRGDMLTNPADPPNVTQRIQATLVWMAETPLALRRPYLLKHTSQQLCAEVSSLISRLDVNTMEQTQRPAELCLNDIGAVEIETHRPLFCDSYSHNRTTGSFILIDPISNETLAAGMIVEGMTDCPDSCSSGTTRRGLTVWFTGLSSAGKSTLNQAIYERLWVMGHKVESLDGDAVRRGLCRDLGFSKQDRDENIHRIGFVAELLTRNGVIVLVSAISPYRTARDELRRRIGDFVEVYVNAPLEVCEMRDVKGLYSRARAGQLPDFTGIDSPYEPPLNPDVECKTDQETLAESTRKVMRFLESRLASVATASLDGGDS